MSPVPVHDFAPRTITPTPETAPTVDRTLYGAGGTLPPALQVSPAVDRTMHEAIDTTGRSVVIEPTSKPVAAPVSRAPNNVHELNALLAERAREDASGKRRELAPHLSLAAQTSSALAVLDATQQGRHPLVEVPRLEADARSRLQDAINVRAGAREAVAAQEKAFANAKTVEHEAIAAESRSRLEELDGGDRLAREITAWAERGGERPELAPDADSLDARHARYRAGAHRDAARQAVTAIGEVLEAKRHALGEAETKVRAAACGVIESVAEDIAIEGRKAGVIHRRAETAALALLQMQHGTIGEPVRYALKPETADLAAKHTGYRKGEPANMVEGATATWTAFQRALEADANAALG